MKFITFTPIYGFVPLLLKFILYYSLNQINIKNLVKVTNNNNLIYLFLFYFQYILEYYYLFVYI